MLTVEEKREIESQLGDYEVPSALCVEALKIVQEHRGWVTDEAVGDIAALLRMSPAEVEGVATFYNHLYRRPVGRHVIRICDSVTCWIMGYENLLAHLQQQLGVALGQTTADGLFTLLPVPCLGICDHAPAMMIGDELYVDLTAEKIDRVLEAHRLKTEG
jgi:NADH-quinone oxidoreductase subunit E